MREGQVALALGVLGEPVNGAVGPQGGNADHAGIRSERRRAGLNVVEVDGAGVTTLHRSTEHEYKDTASTGIKDEQPWHLMAAYMIVAGRTNSEIALAARVKPEHVAVLRAQRWFQERLAVIANAPGQDIVGLLHAEAAASLEKLVSLRDYSESERVQLVAATTLFEHSQGKPVQKIVSNIAHSVASPQDEYAEIQQELRALRARNAETNI